MSSHLFSPIYRFFSSARDPEEVRRAYGIPDNITFHFEARADGWMVITSDQLPGLVTEGRDFQELLEMFNDAVLTYFDVPRRDADIIFPAIGRG